MVVRRDSGVITAGIPRLMVVNFYSGEQPITKSNFSPYPRVCPGGHRLTKKTEDPGYEIVPGHWTSCPGAGLRGSGSSGDNN